MNISSFINKVLNIKTTNAHCDIPCGIYTPEPAKTAAETVLKMVEKIKELPQDGSPEEIMQARNSFVRMVAIKEEHAQICKKELLILWTDYFKEEHLKMFPDLHDKFWKATKLCSKNKREINLKSAEELRGTVDEIADMFNRTRQQ